MANLTPLILMAGEGIVNNTAFNVNSTLSSGIATYLTQTTISSYNTTLSILNTNKHTDDGGTETYGVHQTIIDSYTSMLDTNAPYLVNRIPTTKPTTISVFTDFLNNHLANLMPTENGEYALYLQIASGQAQTANSFINSATNGESLSAQTFSSMDALITGNISAVNKFTNAWGQDLINTGKLFDFSRIDILGTPHAILLSLLSHNMLSTISEELEDAGIDMAVLSQSLTDNPSLAMKPLPQKRCYDVFTKITGSKLVDILFVLGIETSNITTLADLLDLTKLFPNSFLTITSLNNGTLENIYTSASGDLATYVSNIETEFSVSMPENIARANAAFRISLQQIKKIHEATPELIGNKAISLETNQGLTVIDGLTEPLPASTLSFYQSTLGSGSGPNGTFYVSDIVGSPAGIPHADTFTTVNTNISTFETASALDDYYLILTTMSNVADGTYDDNPGVDGTVDIPAGLPATGFYLTRDLAITALITEMGNAITVLDTAYPTETSNSKTEWDTSIDHIITELQQLQEGNVQFIETYTSYNSTGGQDGFPASIPASLSFASNLHTYGKITDKGNVAEILEKVANTATQGGQAIIGAMREGRNLRKLTDSGIATDNVIDSTPSVIEPGDIQSSTY